MATDFIPANLPLEVATTLAQLRRENERLHTRIDQLEEEARALLVLQELAQTLGGELHLPALLKRIARAALRLTSGHTAAVYLLDAKRGMLSLEATERAANLADSGPLTGFDPAADSLPGISGDHNASGIHSFVALEDGVAGWVASNNTVVLIADPSTDARFSLQVLAVDSRLLGAKPTSLVAVPMVFKSVVTGVLQVAQTSAGEGFDARSLDLMRTLAAQAAVAVANAQLYRRLRRERDRIIQAQEDERKRLGRDLHDGPAQRLSQIVMSLDFAEQLAKREPQRLPQELRAIREQAQVTTREIRNFLFDLRPLILEAESGGLDAALKHFLDRFNNQPSPRMHLSAQYTERLPHNAEITVFTIIQEAVNNVLKHANAENCWIDIREQPGHLIATIRDDGAGFDPKQLQSEYESRGSWGLLSMLERASLIEAKLSIGSQLGHGTVVSLDTPR